MDKKMFCFQCEQTVGCTGCTGNAGVCGKKADTAKLQDELTGALIGLARAVDGAETISKRTGQVIIEGLFTTVTNVSFDNAAIENMIRKVRAEKERLVPDCGRCQSPCGKTDEYDMQQLWNARRRYPFLEVSDSFRDSRNGSLCLSRKCSELSKMPK